MSASRLVGMDMNLLLVLDALLVEQNATRAAARLGMTQSAVSRSLSRLRSHLGDPLFVRVPTGLMPTPRAESIAEDLRRALDDLGATLDRVAEFQPGESTRTFAIATADFAGFQVMPGLARILGQEAPGIAIVTRVPGRTTLDDLESGVLDVALGIFPDAPASYRRKALFRDRFACLVRRDHPILGDADNDSDPPLPLDHYLELGHVLIAIKGQGGGFVDSALGQHGAQRRIAVTVPHFMVAPLVVAQSDLVLTLPRRVALHFAAREPLQVLAPPVELPEFAISQLWHERMQNDPAHSWLRDALSRATSAE